MLSGNLNPHPSTVDKRPANVAPLAIRDAIPLKAHLLSNNFSTDISATRFKR
jgi:hypothetical protein